MDRLKDIAVFTRQEFRNPTIIEPASRIDKVWDHLIDIIRTYKPGVIIKAGLGSGEILARLAEAADAYIAVVEPSEDTIREFIARHNGGSILEKIHFIIGEFNRFPIDYYAADLLVCVDYLEFLESGPVIDEFRRSLQFEGILFIAGPVLNDEDIEGLYDDFMRIAFPLHNDYYLREDLKTFLDLNEFTFVKGTIENLPADLAKRTAQFDTFFSGTADRAYAFLEEHRDSFASLYHLDGTIIAEPYYLAVFMRRKPPKPGT